MELHGGMTGHTKLTDEDVAKISKETGHDFRGVYMPSDEGMEDKHKRHTKSVRK